MPTTADLGNVPSAFAPNNLLYDAASGSTLIGNQNALLQQEQSRQLFPLKLQGAQQDLAANETEAVARAAGGLLTLPEDQAAAAYPQVIAGMRAQGYKLANAPDTYPGHTALQGLFQRGLSVPEQISSGMYTPPGLADALKGVYGGGAGGTLASPYKAYAAGTPAPPGAYGEGGKGANIQVPAAYMPFYQEASQRTGIPVDVLIAQHRQESGFNPNATGSAGEIGIGQVMPSTALAPGYGMAPLGTNADAVRTALRDPRTNINFSADYLKARLPQGANPSDPEAIRRALVNYNGGGDPNYVANVTRYLPPPAAVAQAAAAPQPAAGVAARTGGVDVAGPGAGAPSAAPAADLVGPRPMPPTGAGAPVATPSSIANTPVVPTGPGINPVLAGQPAATALSPQNALAPPATPPQAAAPATGTNSPQFQAALALQNQALELETRFPGNPQAKAAAAALRQRAALYMQADSVVVDPTTGIQTHVLTGKQDPSAQPDVKQIMTGEGVLTTDPKTGAVINRIPIAPNIRATPVPGVDEQGRPGTVLYQGNKRIGFEPSATRPALGGFEVQKEDYARDQSELPKIASIGQQAQTSQVRIQQMRELADKINSGAAGNTRANSANIADTLGWHDVAKQLIGVGDAQAAQIFAKYGLMGAGTAERQDLGARGSLGAITLYKQANPGLDLQPGANQHLLAAQLIAAQADTDYSQAALRFGNQAGDAFRHDKGDYVPLTHFDQLWQEQRNPQIYAAAMGALAGDPAAKWQAALNANNPQDINRVLDIIRRADPTATVMWTDGKPYAVTPKK